MQNKWIYLAVYCLFGVVFMELNSTLFLLSVLLTFGYLFVRNKKIAISCFSVFVGISLYYYLYDSFNVTQVLKTQQNFSGKIVSKPVINGDQLRFLFKLNNGEKLYFTYKIQTEEQKNSFSHLSSRSTCKFKGHVIKPKEARNFYVFDFKQYLYRNHIHWMVEPINFSVSKCENESNSLLDQIHMKRAASLKFIDSQFPAPLDGFVQALIFGERGLLEEDTLKSYQDLGLIHLLAISGMHVSLISAFTYFLLVRIGVTKEKAIYTIMLLLPLYVLIAGSTPSVIRAAIMTFLLLVKLRYPKFPLAALDLISLAFILMVLANPYYIFQAGFQLSFIVTLALIVSNKTILQKYTSLIGQLSASSVVAQISSLPIILYHFYQFSLLSIPLNLLYIPLITFIILPMSIGLYVLSIISPTITNYILPLSNELLILVNKVALHMAKSDWQLLALGRPPILLIVAYIFVIVYTFLMWEKHRLGFHRTFLPLIVLIALHWCFPYISPKGEVTFIDVGQGDSILIELPFRKEVYLIDTGGMIPYEQESWKKKKDPFSISEDIIIPYLNGKGIRKIDKLILTHPDFDHIGETNKLLDHITISEILMGANSHHVEGEETIIRKAKKENVKVKKVKKGDAWSSFRVLSPDKPYESKNEGSIVLSAFLGGKTWLFTGDIEQGAEESLIDNYPNLRTDVLKVAHHGSSTSTSTELLHQLRPSIAVISVGLNNRYKHPNSEVLKRLEENDVQVLRTDQLGAIRYIFFHNRQGTFQSKIPYDMVR